MSSSNVAADTLLTYAQAIGALLFVLALVVLIGRLVKRYGHKIGLPVIEATQQEGMNIVSQQVLDHRYRLVTVREAGHEHVLLLGPQAGAVVRTGEVNDAA